MNTLNAPLELVLAAPRGFCAGVERAIQIVQEALRQYGPPLYVRHQVVHNQFVVDDLKKQGAIFVEELDEVPDDSIVIFSAHGVSLEVKAEAKRRGLKVFDATCPLVTKVHLEVARMRAQGLEIVMVGHRGHPETAGTMGQSDQGMYLVETIDDVAALQVARPNRLAYVTQTTLSVDDAAHIVQALQNKFPQIIGPKKEDICYATQNRQEAVKFIAVRSDLVLVVGAHNSSNSNRLREVAERSGVPSYLVAEVDELNEEWLAGCKKITITAGASTPEHIVQELVKKISSLVDGRVSIREEETVKETVIFPLPKILGDQT